MLVKCINNDGDTRLKLGEYYIINVKIFRDKSMSLVGMGGKYFINRFINDKNEKIKPEFYYINKRYNPPLKTGKYGYVIPIPNRMKHLERKLYKIECIKTKYDTKSITGHSFKKIQIKEDGTFNWWYSAKNFLFYSNEEADQILREQKIEQIIKHNE